AQHRFCGGREHVGLHINVDRQRGFNVFDRKIELTEIVINLTHMMMRQGASVPPAMDLRLAKYIFTEIKRILVKVQSAHDHEFGCPGPPKLTGIFGEYRKLLGLLKPHARELPVEPPGL